MAPFDRISRFAYPSRRRALGLLGLSVTSLVLTRPAGAQTPPAAPLTTRPIQRIAIRPGEARLKGPDGPVTALTGFDGAAQGPLLRVARGADVTAEFDNQTPDPLTIRWRGCRVPNALDGVAGLTQPPQASGDVALVSFKAKDAGVYLYQAIPAASAVPIAQRPTGLLIVDEPDPPPVDHDLAFLIEDWRLGEKGEQSETGAQTVTVNAGPAAMTEIAQNDRLRLRIANASLNRFLKLKLDTLPPDIVALDGQPTEPFRPKDGLFFLSPGGRAEIIVDAALEPGQEFKLALDGKDQPVIATFRVAAGAPKRPAPLGEVKPLATNGLPEQLDQGRAQRAEITIEAADGGHRLAVAGKPLAFDPKKPLFTIKRGRTVALGLVNKSSAVQAVHVHGHPFRLLDAVYDGWQPYWLDTALIPPNFTQRIAFLADTPGKWAIDAQPIEARTAGPTTWFEVTP